MATYDTSLPATDSNGSSLAGAFSNAGVPFTLSPNGSGNFQVTTDSANSATVESMLRSSGITGTSGSSDYGTLAGVYGNADTSNDGANAGSGLNNNGSTDSKFASQANSLISKYGTDGIAIVVGALFVAGSIYGMMTK